MTAFEGFIGEEVRKARSILGLYPPTDPKAKDNFAAWRKGNARQARRKEKGRTR